MEKFYGKGLDKELSVLRILDGATLDTKQKEDVLVQIGNLSRKPGSVLKSMHDDLIKEILGDKILEEPVSTEGKKSKKKESSHTEHATAIIGKERDIPYRTAQCCHPTSDDKKIVGVIGQGIVTLHRFDCPEVDKVELERRIPARWSDMPEGNTVNFTIDITFSDRKGMLMRLTQVFYQLGLNIQSFSTDRVDPYTVKNRFIFETEDDDYYIYERLEARLRFEMPEDIRDIQLIHMA